MADPSTSDHIVVDDATANAASSSKPTTPLTSKSGWDGKLRVTKQATLANPEALSDPDYSDEDAPPVQQIDADEGMQAA
jgi:protein phosphatase 1 regulatory subunit 7